MSGAAIAWIVVGGLFVLAVLIMFFKSLPELRRYLRVRKM